MAEPLGVLDRAAHLRKDEAALASMLAGPDTLVVATWRHKNLVATAGEPRPVLLTVAELAELLPRSGHPVWLGMLGERPCFAVRLPDGDDVPGQPPLRGRGDFVDLRVSGSFLSPSEADLLVYARGMLLWQRNHAYCGRCGGALRPAEGGHVGVCSLCEQRSFPRSDPAVMVLITRGESCLLARQPRFPPGMYSVLAGFVEPGESLEETVVRESFEEVGLCVRDPRYLRSQPWPFPGSLMIGFSARSDEGDIRVDGDEIEEARWFTRAELRDPDGFFIPPPFSLAHQLIRAHVDGG